jgi:hypothetical protein
MTTVPALLAQCGLGAKGALGLGTGFEVGESRLESEGNRLRQKTNSDLSGTTRYKETSLGGLETLNIIEC